HEILGDPLPELPDFSVVVGGALVSNASPGRGVATLEIQVNDRGRPTQTLQHDDPILVIRRGHFGKLIRIEWRDVFRPSARFLSRLRQLEAESLAHRALHQFGRTTKPRWLQTISNSTIRQLEQAHKIPGRACDALSLEEEPAQSRL